MFFRYGTPVDKTGVCNNRKIYASTNFIFPCPLPAIEPAVIAF
jgi:hypothetical protein